MDDYASRAVEVHGVEPAGYVEDGCRGDSKLGDKPRYSAASRAKLRRKNPNIFLVLGMKIPLDSII